MPVCVGREYELAGTQGRSGVAAHVCLERWIACGRLSLFARPAERTQLRVAFD
jgi:hypothetical protein